MNNTQRQVHSFLYPNSIAIVGASNNTGKTGGRLLSYLLRHHFKGKIYPVNPKEETVQGLTAYPSVSEIPDSVDLAVLIVGNQQVLNVMKDCANKGIGSVLIISSGFSETGAAGEQLQKEIVDFAGQAGIRICGPNTNGIVNTNHDLFLSFSMAMEIDEIPEGNISFITQSGAIGGGMLSLAWDEGIGVGISISSGNESDLETADFLDYLLDDNNTKVICLFMEGITDGTKFRNVLRRAKRTRKPIVVYKNGRTEAGLASVKSHTGSMAGSYQIFQSLFRQYGVISVHCLEEMFETAKALSVLPLPKGNRVGVVSTSGGACTILADHCIENGLALPDLSEHSKGVLTEVIPAFTTAKNPLDMTAEFLTRTHMLKDSLQTFLNDDNIDSIIVMITTVGEPHATKVADDLIDICRHADKPVLVSWTIAEKLAQNGIAKLRKAKIPLYPSAEKAVKVLHYMTAFAQTQEERTTVTIQNGSEGLG